MLQGGLVRLDWYVLSLLYAPMLCGMMAEEGPIPIAGDHISFDDLHAEIISLLLKEEYGASFRTDRHTYRMNNDRTILALQGARSTLKIFEYNNDLEHYQQDTTMTECQTIEGSLHFALHPQGSALAVIKKETEDKYCLEYYIHRSNGAFEPLSDLDLENGLVQSLNFNNDGSQIKVGLLIEGRYQEKLFGRNNEDEIVPLALLDKLAYWVKHKKH